MAGKRGPGYPFFALPEAVERARQLYQQDGRSQTAPDVAVKAWGYTGLNGASLRALSALKQYGLLEAADDYVKLTDTALAILVEPEGSLERLGAIGAAAVKPVVFAALASEYPGDLPSDATLVAYLVRKQGFHEESAKKIVESFRETVEFAKQSSSQHITPSTGVAQTGRQTGTQAIQQSAHRLATGGERMDFTWPLSGDAVATLSVSRKLDLDDIQTLEDYFEIAKRTLRKAASAPPATGGDSTQGTQN